jgi:YYY domain-containing protein
MDSIIPFIFWYFFITLLGLLAFPLVYVLFPALADRGYAFSRAVGLLVWGYLFWLLASLGVLRNDLGGLLLALAGLGGLAWIAVRRAGIDSLRAWLNGNRRSVWSIEILFLVAFAGWAFVRSTNPEIAGTEKPMELAFINAILHSPTFPPHDPWLSGYSISYYYFGYVLVAMLAKLTAVPGGIAFNLGISLIFALTAIGAYGLVYTLLLVPGFGRVSEKFARGYAILGTLFILIVSNLEGFLEILHARGLFWRAGVDGQQVSSFWSWLDLKELSLPPGEPFSWIPTRYLWWWRASRVVQDYDLAGNWKEIIDEFPFFSYLLADLHPHVLAMPFALLAIAIALNLFMGGATGSLKRFGLHLEMNASAFLFAALALGGLAFLNTWDFPIYVGLACGAYTLRSMILPKVISEGADSSPPSWKRWVGEFILLGIALGLSGILLYLPFYLGFSSQAGGLLANLVYSTRGAQLWIMFGPLLIPVFAFLFLVWRRANRPSAMKGLLTALGVILALWLLSIAFGLMISGVPAVRDLYFGTQGSTSQVSTWLLPSIIRRFVAPGWLTLLTILAVSFGLLRSKNSGQDDPVGLPLLPARFSPSAVFTILLVIAGALLVLIPEFFYLRDQFGWRMNTIFKFYYQAWLLWGIAAGFGAALLLRELRGGWAVLFGILLTGMVLASLAYPLLSLWNKTSEFNPPNGRTLDGAAFFNNQESDDSAAIHWLSSAPPGNVVEAVGPQYSEYARVATFSGQPTVLGWPGHESQWRGGEEEMGSRQVDIETLYRTKDWEQTREILDRYNVRYVYIGPLERNTYPVNEDKFKRNLTPVFEQGQVVIYEVPKEIVQ